VSLSATAINDCHAYRIGIWLQVNCPEFIRNDQWSGLQIRLTHGLACLPCLGCDVGELYHKLHPKAKSITELKEALEVIWDCPPQEPINKASHYDWRDAPAKAGGEQFEHTKWLSNIRQVFTVLFQWSCFALFWRGRFSASENRLVVTLKYQWRRCI